MTAPKPGRLILALCILAAVFYNSWPLGYVLNSHTAHYDLASDLSRAGQPYFWLFILGDVLTGVCSIVAGLLMRFKLWPKARTKASLAVYVGLIVFGAFTAAAVLMPSEGTLDDLLSKLVYNGQGLGLDALLSVIAMLGLVASVVGVIYINKFHKARDVKLIVPVLSVTWVVSGLAFVIAATNGGGAHLLQQLLSILSGIVLVIIGLSVDVFV